MALLSKSSAPLSSSVSASLMGNSPGDVLSDNKQNHSQNVKTYIKISKALGGLNHYTIQMVKSSDSIPEFSQNSQSAMLKSIDPLSYSHSQIFDSIIEQFEIYKDKNNVYHREKSRNIGLPEDVEGDCLTGFEPKVIGKPSDSTYCSILLPQNKAYGISIPNSLIQQARRSIFRVYYVRRDEFRSTFDICGFLLQKNDLFGQGIYEPQLYLTRVVHNNVEDTGTSTSLSEPKLGLCPFCPDEHFFEIETSAYRNHLAFEHGVGADSYLTPDPIAHDHDIFASGHNVRCPTCFERIQIKEGLSSKQYYREYLKHFEIEHRREYPGAESFRLMELMK